jgi:hypothetical protein
MFPMSVLIMITFGILRTLTFALYQFVNPNSTNIPFNEYGVIKMTNLSSSTMIKVSIVVALVVAAALIAAGFNSNNSEVRIVL